MEVKVNVGGIEAVVTVENAAEAASFLKSLREDAPPQSTPATSPVSEPNSQPTATKSRIRDALAELYGSKSSSIVVALKKHPEGCTDVQLRETARISEDANLGPLFSNISKACNRMGISRDDILTTKKRRVAGGKIEYFYLLTDAAAKVLGDMEEDGPEPGALYR